MIIGVDEVGKFESVKPNDFGIVVLVSITDSELLKFNSFLNSVFPHGHDGVKGKNISDKDREKILKYIGKKQEIKYSALMFDSSLTNNQSLQVYRSGQLKKFLDYINQNIKTINPVLKDEMTLLHNQMKNLKRADFLKLLLVYLSYNDWIKFFQFDYLHTNAKNDSWHVKHRIDMQNAPDKFKNILSSFMFLTMNELNPDFSINCPKEWGRDHPFHQIHTYQKKDHLFDAKIFWEDFLVTNEEDEPVLFLPDLIGNTIYRSITRQKEKKWLKMLKRVKSNRSICIKLKDKDCYYQINGIDKTKNKSNVSETLKSHYKLMKNL